MILGGIASRRSSSRMEHRMAPNINRVGDLTVFVERPASPKGKPPVLLIHGMFGGAWLWEKYQAYLARSGYESHAMNLRGHHGSRPVRDIGKVSLDDYVADALEVAAALKNPIVMGHSMGGLIAQKVAEAGGCRAAVLIASAPPRWITAASWLLLRRQLKNARALILSEALTPDRDDADFLVFNRTPLPRSRPILSSDGSGKRTRRTAVERRRDRGARIAGDGASAGHGGSRRQARRAARGAGDRPQVSRAAPRVSRLRSPNHHGTGLGSPVRGRHRMDG